MRHHSANDRSDFAHPASSRRASVSPEMPRPSRPAITCRHRYWDWAITQLVRAHSNSVSPDATCAARHARASASSATGLPAFREPIEHLAPPQRHRLAAVVTNGVRWGFTHVGAPAAHMVAAPSGAKVPRFLPGCVKRRATCRCSCARSGASVGQGLLPYRPERSVEVRPSGASRARGGRAVPDDVLNNDQRLTRHWDKPLRYEVLLRQAVPEGRTGQPV